MGLWDWIGGGQPEDEDARRRRQIAELQQQTIAAPPLPDPAPLPTVLAAPAVPLADPGVLDEKRQADDAEWRRLQTQAGQAPITPPSTPRLWDSSLNAPQQPAAGQQPVPMPQQASQAQGGAPTSDFDPQKVDPTLLAKADAYAAKYGIDRDLFRRQIWRESKFDPGAVNPNSGAAGLGQFMPQTAAGLGVDTRDPDSSLDGAARYLRANLDASGGDYRRALVSYNWGPGNAARWNGSDEALPDETRTYLADILGSGKQAPSPTSAPQTPGQPIGSLTPDQHQMSLDEGLDEATAWAVCGPAAAIAFARRTGSNPTMRQALALAQEVGWTVGSGMAGPGSEQKLLGRMGIASKLVDGTPDWSHVVADIQAGNPVIISTPGHYFVAEGYDPQTGKLNLGASAAILRAANHQSWFTPDELNNLGMGAARAAIYLDNPGSPLPSTVAGRSQGYYQPAAQARVPTLLDQAVQTAQSAVETSRQALDSSLQLLQQSGLKSLGAAHALNPLIPSNPLQLVDDARGGDWSGLGMDLVDPNRRSSISDPEQTGLLGWGQILSRNAANATVGIVSSLDSLAGGALATAGLGDTGAARFFRDSRDYFDGLQRDDPRYRTGTHARSEIDIWDPKTYADPETYAAAIGQVIPSMLASMATAGLAGAMLGGAGEAALIARLPFLGSRAEALGSALFTLPTSAGSTYEDLKKLGYDDRTALFGGLLSGGLQSALEVVNPHEAVPVWKKLFSGVDPTTSFGRRLVGAARELATGTLKEAGEEGAQQLADNVVQKWFGSDKSWLDQVPENFVLGGLGNFMGGAGALRTVVGDRTAIKNANDRAIVEKAMAAVNQLAGQGEARPSSEAPDRTQAPDHRAALAELDARVADLADRVDDDQQAYDDWRTSEPTMRETQALSDRMIAERTRGVTDPARQQAIEEQVIHEINGRSVDRWLDSLGDRRGEVAGRLDDFKTLSGARDEVRQAAAAELRSQGRARPDADPLQAPSEAAAPSTEGQQDEPKYDFSSTQLDLSGEPAARIRALQQRIDPADLVEREPNPHVTVKYGLDDHAPDTVRSIAQGTGPATLRFGKTSVFPDDGKRGSDVVKVDVDGPRLRMLNDQLGRLPNGDTHPEYTPHATVAYVRPGTGAKYAGLDDLDGLHHTAEHLTFSDRNGTQHQIPLSNNVENMVANKPATEWTFGDAEAALDRGEMPPREVVDRFYDRATTGTKESFGRYDPEKFDPNALVGPALYATDNTELSSSYAVPEEDQARLRYSQEDQQAAGQLGSIMGLPQSERRPAYAAYERDRAGLAADYPLPYLDSLSDDELNDEIGNELRIRGSNNDPDVATGGNVRPVLLPKSMRFLDLTERGIFTGGLDSLLDRLDDQQYQQFSRAQNEAARHGGNKGEAAYEALTSLFGGDRAATNRALAGLGYDGIRYDGGLIRPMYGSDGSPIRHTATAIFSESLDKIRNGFTGEVANLTSSGSQTDTRFRDPAFSSRVASAEGRSREPIRIAEGRGARVLQVRGQMDLEAQNPALKALIDQVSEGRDLASLGPVLSDAVNAIVQVLSDPRIGLIKTDAQRSTFAGFLVGAVNVLGHSDGQQSGPRRIFVNPHEILAQMLAEIERVSPAIRERDPAMDPASREFRERFAGELVGAIVHEVLHGPYNKTDEGGGVSHPERHFGDSERSTINQVLTFLGEDTRTGKLGGMRAGASLGAQIKAALMEKISDGLVARMGAESATLREEVAKSGESTGSAEVAGPEQPVQPGPARGDDAGGGGERGPVEPAGVRDERAGRPAPAESLRQDQVGQSEETAGAADAAGSHVHGIPADVADRATGILEEMTSGDPDVDTNGLREELKDLLADHVGNLDGLRDIIRGSAPEKDSAAPAQQKAARAAVADALGIDARQLVQTRTRDTVAGSTEAAVEAPPTVGARSSPQAPTNVTNRTRDGLSKGQRILQNQVRVTNLVTSLAQVADDGAITWVEPRSRNRLGGEEINADELAEAIKLLVDGADPVVTDEARSRVAALDLPANLRVEVREAPDGTKKVALFVGREGTEEQAPHEGPRRPADERVLRSIGTYVGDVDPGVVERIQKLLEQRRERALTQAEQEALAITLGVHPGEEDNHLLEVAKKIVAAGPRYTAEPAVIARALKMALAEAMSELTTAARDHQAQVAAGTLTQAQADAFIEKMYNADELTALVGATKQMATMFGRGLNVFRQATAIQLAQQAFERAQRMNEDLALARAVMDRLSGYYGENIGFGVENDNSYRASVERLENEVANLQYDLHQAERAARDAGLNESAARDYAQSLRERLDQAQQDLQSLRDSQGAGPGNGPGTGGGAGNGPGNGMSLEQAKQDISLLVDIFGRWNPEALGGMNMGWDTTGDARHVRTAEQLQEQDPLEFMRRIMAKGFTTAPERSVRAAAARANRARRSAREAAALEGNGDLEAVDRMNVEDMVAMVAAGAHFPTFRESMGEYALLEQQADRIKDPVARATQKAQIKRAMDHIVAQFQREVTRRMRVERHNRTAEQNKMTPDELEILVNELVGAYDAQSAKKLAVLLANDATPETRAERIVRLIRDEHRGVVNDEAAALRYWIDKAAEVERTYGSSDPATAQRIVNSIDDAIDRLAEHAAIGGGEKAAEKLRSRWAAARGGAGVRLVDSVIKANVGKPLDIGNPNQLYHPTTAQREAVDSSHWRRVYGKLVTAVLEHHDDLTAVAALDTELAKLEKQTSNPLASQVARQVRRMVTMERLRAEARSWFREVEANPTDRWTRGTALAAVAAVGKLVTDKDTPPWLRERWADLPYALEDQLDRSAERGAERIQNRLARDEKNEYKREISQWISKLSKDPQDPEARAAVEDALDRMRGDGHVTAADALERVLAIRTADATSAVVQAGSDLSNSTEEVKAAASEISDLLDQLITLQGRDRGAQIAPLIADLYANLRTMGDYGWAAEERSRNRVMAASLERMGQKAGVIGTADYLHFIALLNPDDPTSIARALRFIQHPTLMKYLRELGVINLLSSPSTWGPLGTNSVSQMLTEALMVVRWPFEYLGDLGRYAVQRVQGKDAVRTRFKSELGAAAGALADLRTYKGFADAASIMLTGHSSSEAWQAVKTGDARQLRTEYLTQLGAGWREAKSPAGKVKYAALYTLGSLLHAASTRPLAALDAIHASTLYSLNLAMQAEREARLTGRTAQAVLADPKTATHVIERAGHLRDFALLQLPSTTLRKLIRGINETLQVDDPRQPIWKKVLELLWRGEVPFTTVPVNATKQGLELSPLGASVNAVRAGYAIARGSGTLERAIRDEAAERGVDEALIRARGTDESLRRAAESGGKTATLLGSAAVGFLLFAAAVTMKMAGMLTGDPPDDENERENWEAHNLKPRSIYLGPLGWRSYDSTAVSIPFAMVANAMQNTEYNYRQLRKAGWGEGFMTYLAAGSGSAAMGAASATMHNFFLGGIAELANLPTTTRQQGLAGGAKLLAGSAQGLVHQAIPLSGLLGFMARWGDDYNRDTRDDKSVLRDQILNRTASGLPDFMQPLVHPLGLETRGDLPIKLNPRGESVPNDLERGLGTALGAKPETRTRADLGADLLARYDMKLGDPPASYSLGAQGTFILTPQEKRKFASDTGALLDAELARSIGPDGEIGPQAPPGASPELRRRIAQQALASAIQRARTQAGRELWLSLGPDDASRRLAARLRAQQAAALKNTDFGAELDR